LSGLEGKITIVAGGATGIGAETARRLALAGARVVVGDVNFKKAQDTVANIIAAGGEALAVGCDISLDADVKALIETTVDRFGGLDFIHVNAADLSIIQQDLDALEVSMDIFDRTIAVDIRGHLLCTRHALPEILRRGGGGIVYTSSGASVIGEPTRVSYAIAKAGVDALMRHVASRWGRQGIRSNAVSPGLVLSETVKNTLPQAEQDRQLADARSTRLGKPTDIAAAVVYLMSAEAEWINGQIICVDGGRILG
jgi:NAD(P)-dependent dehydrogenase (short-subunit alcohol dehydrogenase family)